MNIFLLGNGFDLHHDLPTEYINFLNTVDFLLHESLCDSYSTVGKVFSNPKLKNKDEKIKNCNERYKSVYESIAVDETSVQQIIDLANKNDWFRYMLECYRRSSTWIDFEKEIARVCSAFEKYFEKCRKSKNFSVSSKSETTFKYFSTIFREELSYSSLYNAYQTVLNVDNRFIIYDKKQPDRLNELLIVETLFDSLNELAKMLSLYLKLFVDNTIDELVAKDLIKRNNIFCDVDQVFTLNYTNTFAKVYGNDPNKTLHIHGEVDAEIVLGVQTDDRDELQYIDTTFIQFKKYFQRSMYETDLLLNMKIFELKQSKDTVKLSVMGHSLDITDRDIIKKLFGVSDKIIIYYYGDKKAKGICIKKLIHIFGQEKYEELVTRTLLEYQSLPNAT